MMHIKQEERQNEYDDVFVARLQMIWGEGFLSPGGADEVRFMLENVPLAGQEVLDFGCGIGGVDILLATEHQAERVLGIDIEQPVLDRAMQRAKDHGLTDKIEYMRVDNGLLPIEDDSFDVIFSKDVIIQVPDKPLLFQEFHRILRPGGIFVAHDWLRSPAPETPELNKYLTAAEYEARMATRDETREWLESAGFENVVLTDHTDWLLQDSLKTHERIIGPLEQQARDLIGDYRYERWVQISNGLCGALAARELHPTHMLAHKPTD